MRDDFKKRLQQIGEQLDPAFRDQGQHDIDALVQAGAQSFGDLLVIVQARETSDDLASSAAWLLGRLGSKRAASALLAALTAAASARRQAAAHALGELDVKAAVQPLIVTMRSDASDDVRQAATYALGLIGAKRALSPLIAVLADQTNSPGLRGMAAEALSDVRDRRAVPALLGALGDVSPEVRFWAAFALGELGDPQALPELERIAATDRAPVAGRGTVRKEAEAAIQRIREQDSSD